MQILLELLFYLLSLELPFELNCSQFVIHILFNYCCLQISHFDPNSLTFKEDVDVLATVIVLAAVGLCNKFFSLINLSETNLMCLAKSSYEQQSVYPVEASSLKS